MLRYSKQYIANAGIAVNVGASLNLADAYKNMTRPVAAPATTVLDPIYSGDEFELIIVLAGIPKTDITKIDIDWKDTNADTLTTGFIDYTVATHTYATPGTYAPSYTITFTDGSTVTKTVDPPVIVGGIATLEAVTTTFTEPEVNPTPPNVVNTPQLYPIDLPVPTQANEVCIDVNGVPFCVSGPFPDTPRPIEILYNLPTTPGPVTITPTVKYPDGSENEGPTTTITVVSEASSEANAIVFDDPVGNGTPKTANEVETIDIIVPVPSIGIQVCVDIDGIETCVSGPFTTSPVSVPVTWGTAPDSPQTVTQIVKYDDGSTNTSTPVDVVIQSIANDEAPSTTITTPSIALPTEVVGQELEFPIVLPDPSEATEITIDYGNGNTEVITAPFTLPITPTHIYTTPGSFTPVVTIKYSDNSTAVTTGDPVMVLTKAEDAEVNDIIIYTNLATTESVPESVEHPGTLQITTDIPGLVNFTWQYTTQPLNTVTALENTVNGINHVYSILGPAYQQIDPQTITIVFTFDDGSSFTRTTTLTVDDVILPAIASTEVQSAIDDYDAGAAFGDENLLNAIFLQIPGTNPGKEAVLSVLQMPYTGAVSTSQMYWLYDDMLEIAGANFGGSSPRPYQAPIVFGRFAQVTALMAQWFSDNKNNPTELNKMRDPNFAEDVFKPLITMTPLNPTMAQHFAAGALFTIGLEDVQVGFTHTALVSFQNNNYAPIISGITYDFGDGEPSGTIPGEASIDHIYTVSGTYTKILEATFTDGTKHTITTIAS